MTTIAADALSALRRFHFKLCALTVAACGICSAGAQVNEPGKSWHYMNNPVLPVPPPATEEQLKRGGDLLNTLLKIAANVRLTDSVVVMQELGIDEIYIQKHKDHYWISPKHPSRIELRVQGFESINMVQLYDPYGRGGRSRLSISLLPEITCVTPRAVEKSLEGMPRSLWTRPEVHPTEKPPKQQPFDGIHFSTLSTPDGQIGSISAEFSYQECAINIDLAYPSLKHTESGK